MLTIHHRTTYRYREPVRFEPHRLLLRPRESRDLRLIRYDLEISPAATVSWSQDPFGNAVATADFQEPADVLDVVSSSQLELCAAPWPVFDIAFSAASYPFRYSDDDWTDLGALTAPRYADPTGRLPAWARAFVRGDPTDTLALLKDLCQGVTAWIGYQSRDVGDAQSPIETLDRGWGSCRDMAVLFVEAVRSLGFGARIVSGYLHNPDRDRLGSADAGSTHAWAEVFVPGAGWITFDPTNRSVGGSNLAPVAVARDIRQVTPIGGGFAGPAGAFIGLWVGVDVAAT